MAEPWIKKQPGWIKRDRPPDPPIQLSGLEGVPTQVVLVLRCPRQHCRSRRVRCYGKDNPTLYYKCQDCGHKFKVIEQDEQK